MNKIVYNGTEYKKIVFVCSANKYRSPALQYLFQEKCTVRCDSQGTMKTLKNVRNTKKAASNNKELLQWVSSIDNENVRNKMLYHSQLKFNNEKENLYIFIGDKHLSKYAHNLDNCISISEFVDDKNLEDPLVFVRNKKDANKIWLTIEKIVDSIILKIIE